MENQLEERIAALEKQVFMCKNILTFDEASKFLNLSKSYLYKLTSAGRIPFYRPQGKLVYFERTELEIWLRQNLVKTREQIEFEAQRYIQMNKLLKK